MLLVQVGGGVELLREELVDDGGHDLRGVEVQVVAARQLAVHEVRVVLAEDLAEPGVSAVSTTYYIFYVALHICSKLSIS